MTEKKSLIENLRSLNSKERFFLIGQVLGNPDFQPDPQFLEKLGVELSEKLTDPIPNNVFAAMDYHLDWIYASLCLAYVRDSARVIDSKPIFDNRQKKITASHEDIDFIIAFESNEITHIILIEAKGVTNWGSKQLESKKRRLIQIFGAEGSDWKNVIPHFVMMSPRSSKRLDFKKWPDWLKKKDGSVARIDLDLAKTDINCVTRCSSRGISNANGKHWRIMERGFADSEE